MIDTINKAIELSKKRTALLIELKTSLLSESADYIVDQQSDFEYYLIEKSSEKILVVGSKLKIENFLTKRKITKVFYFTKDLKQLIKT